jgi:hypothetical protein
MHVRDIRAFGWIKAASNRLEQCDTFASEFDFLEADPVAMAAALTLPENKSLANVLPRGAWKRLDYLAAKKLGSSAEALQYQHPMGVVGMFTATFMSDEMTYSLDETLWHLARKFGKKTTGVETFASQLDTLERIPFELHIQNLVGLLKHFRQQQKRTKKMMRQYMEGDLQGLYRAAKKDAKGMRKILLYRRNKHMTQRFMEIAADSTLFCAVGAGHLAGGKGMLRLLKKAGYNVQAEPMEA